MGKGNQKEAEKVTASAVTHGEREAAEESPKAQGPWGKSTRDLWFYFFLSLSALSVIVLFVPFFYVLLFALLVVVVSWRLYIWILKGCKGKKGLAAGLTVLVLAVLVFVPLALILYMFLLEAISVVQSALAFVRAGGFEQWATSVMAWRDKISALPDWITQFIPDQFDIFGGVMGAIQDAALTLLNLVGSHVPALLNTTFNITIHLIIFIFAVITLYMEGPRLLQFVKDLSPMDDAYEENLFKAFGELSNSLVVGSLATAVVQGVVAGVGYAIVGLDQVIFYATLTGLLSFMPLVGTTLVWLPMSFFVAGHQGLGWGLFLGLYSAVFTAQIDHFVRPMFMRGSSNIHPLLIFLAFFGGMSWMGIPGMLVGPALVAFFLALYRIYEQDFLCKEPPDPGADKCAPNRGLCVKGVIAAGGAITKIVRSIKPVRPGSSNEDQGSPSEAEGGCEEEVSELAPNPVSASKRID